MKNFKTLKVFIIGAIIGLVFTCCKKEDTIQPENPVVITPTQPTPEKDTIYFILCASDSVLIYANGQLILNEKYHLGSFQSHYFGHKGDSLRIECYGHVGAFNSLLYIQGYPRNLTNALFEVSSTTSIFERVKHKL